MKRTEMIDKLLKLYKDFPEGASDYHKIDFLLRKAERLGMFPPLASGKVEVEETKNGGLFVSLWKWDEEEEDET